MHDIHADAGSIKLFIHDDEDTPVDFVQQLVCTVFGKSEREAIAFHAQIENDKKVACGPYPASVAKAMLEAAQQRIDAAGHDLLITSEIVTVKDGCDLCGAPATDNEIVLAANTVCVCNRCLLAVRCASEDIPGNEFRYACVAIDWHFAGVPQHQLVTRSRQFPGHMRADEAHGVSERAADQRVNRGGGGVGSEVAGEKLRRENTIGRCLAVAPTPGSGRTLCSRDGDRRLLGARCHGRCDPHDSLSGLL